MQKLNSNKLAKTLLIGAVVFAVLAILLGILHSQYSDPESSTPAPYVGFLAFIAALSSLMYHRRASKQNLQTTNKWVYKIVGLIILGIVVYVLIGIILFVQCASSDGCQLFSP
jgi:membrane protease YdiL (CAAX protease family)